MITAAVYYLHGEAARWQVVVNLCKPGLCMAQRHDVLLMLGIITDSLLGKQRNAVVILIPRHADPGAIALSCLGTTHFINAIIRHRGLARVAVLRLCGPATVALPPFCDMPPEHCQAIGGSYHLLSGTSGTITQPPARSIRS